MNTIIMFSSKISLVREKTNYRTLSLYFRCVCHLVHVQNIKLSIALSGSVKPAIWHFPHWKTDRGPTVDFSLFLVPLEFSMFMGRDVEADRFS